jgi:hypothetical protein
MNILIQNILGFYLLINK